ncbi:hypothetical protein MHM83_11100 [Tenacibaculum sp. Mcav3-52]|uniref:hypothetical protein n=1 Tax=Tenacibaculum sp. Mcav3-52 TaxID=2917762 RepID=UPI001EF327CE|nr:hypothetical protein [Tenacibaculum sp. Mcav3-52]MCG7502420.1 hypothetical protein [Tenacibaculum sp. Mcav3-52]
MGYQLLLKILNYQTHSKNYTYKERKKIREQYKLELLKRNDEMAFIEKLFDDEF